MNIHFNLLKNFGNLTSTDGTATFTNRETKTLLHSNRVDQFHSDVVLSPGITISTFLQEET